MPPVVLTVPADPAGNETTTPDALTSTDPVPGPVTFSTITLPHVIVTAKPAGISSWGVGGDAGPHTQTTTSVTVLAVIRTPFVGSGTSSIVAEPLTTVPVVGVARPCTTFEKEPDGVPGGCKVSTIPSPFASGSHASPSESPSLFAWFAFATEGQLSSASGTPSLSASGGSSLRLVGPLSQPAPKGRATPRWSVAGQIAETAASIAAPPCPAPSSESDRRCRRARPGGGHR